MRNISIKAFAKVNLCLDVLGRMEDGYHRVEMILQQIDIHDDINMRWLDDPEADGVDISLSVKGGREGDVPAGRSNLAWKAADEMALSYGAGRKGKLSIEIEKHIPVAAGLAGGSSDCGAVIHGLNILWDLGLDVRQLCETGGKLGSDVPFCIMAQAAADPVLKELFSADDNAGHCAIARGRGTDMEPIKGLRSYMVLAKPDISVSTKEAYEGIDGIRIDAHPDIKAMAEAIAEEKDEEIEKNMINVLEKFTLKRYPMVVYTKNKVQNTSEGPVLMSGSGPTIYCLCRSEEEGRRICEEISEDGLDCFCTMTTS